MKNLLLIVSLGVLLFSCGAEGDVSIDSADSNAQIGKGGSTTRFAIVDGFLYIVENSALKTIDITDAANPEIIDEIAISDELETIFPYELVAGETVLLLGARNGMHVYKIRENGTPNNGDNIVLTHATSCDPVIAQNGYAYVTLRGTDSGCNTGVNELHVMDVSSIESPTEITSIEMTGPKGLSFSQDGSALLVCDADGLKVFSLEDPAAPEFKQNHSAIKCNDILQYEDHYIVTGNNLLEIYTFDAISYLLDSKLDLLGLE